MHNRNHLKIVLGLPLAILGFACGSVSTQAQTLILDQVGTSPATFNSANSYASDNFTSATTSSVLVDDFTAPASALDITNVTATVTGFGATFVSLKNVTGWEVSIYTGPFTATTPIAGNYGATVAPGGVTLTTPYDTSANSGLVSIPVNIVLPAAGKYYVSVEALNSITTNGEVAVYSTAAAIFGGTPAPFPSGSENDFEFTPGATGGFLNPLTTAENGDAAYQITAQPTAVPEPSIWALLGSGALAVAVGAARRYGRVRQALPA